MKVFQAIRKSRYYNEDRIIIGDSYYMVCDGATSLYKSGVSPTEGSWFVSYLKKHLGKKTTDVVGRLSEIAKNAYREFMDMTGCKGDMLYYPSAGLAWAEIKSNKVRLYTIGDCEAVVRLKDGSTIRHIIPNLPKLDQIALDQMIKVSKELGVSILAAKELCKDVLIANRQLMNKPDGYPVFTIDDAPCFEYAMTEYEIQDLSEVYLFTDGITQAFDELLIYPSYKEMFDKSLDLDQEIAKIVKRAYEDRDCNAYPRFKTIDDIAIIKIDFA